MVRTINDEVEHFKERIKDGKPFFINNNIVIVGENTAGKSTLIKESLKKLVEAKNNDVYFVGCKSRNLNSSSGNVGHGLSEYEGTYDNYQLVKNRIKDKYFSDEDYFYTDDIDGGALVYYDISKSTEQYQEIFKAFTSNADFKISKEQEDVGELGPIINSGIETLKFNNVKISDLSSSEKSKYRIIFEIEYAKKRNCKFVIIDEFDVNFDSYSMVEFMNKLVEYYSELRFVFVIHDFDVLLLLHDWDALIITKEKSDRLDNSCYYLDCNDVFEIGRMERIKTKYLNPQKNNEDHIELSLSECISEYIKNGELSHENCAYFNSLKSSELKTRNRVLYDYLNMLLSGCDNK